MNERPPLNTLLFRLLAKLIRQHSPARQKTSLSPERKLRRNYSIEIFVTNGYHAIHAKRLPKEIPDNNH